MARFKLPVVFEYNVLVPIPILSPPAVLLTKELQPAAKLLHPVIVMLPAQHPIAVLPRPVV